MHILISAQTYPSPKNQLSAFVAVLAEEMVRQGEDVTVLAPQSLTTCWRHKIPCIFVIGYGEILLILF